MYLRKEGKVLTNLVAHFIHYGVVIFIISFIIVSVAIDDRKFFYPQTQIEIDGGGISPKASSDIVGEGYSYGNLCTADTAWNTKHVREHLILWLRSLSALPHVKGTLHLPLDNELQNILVLQYYNQAVPQLQIVSRASSGAFAGSAWLSGGATEEAEFINGFYYGPLQQDGTFTGKDLSFIFPDFYTVIRGRYEKGALKEGRAARIVAERCFKGIKQLKIQNAKGILQGSMYKYQALTALRPGDQPTLMDPMERRNVYVGDSPGMGLGIFAKRDIKMGEVICYFAGTVHEMDGDSMNSTKEEENADYKYALSYIGDTSILNILPEYEGLHNFRATLGHLVNHSFKKMSEYILATHPRYGLIRAVLAMRDFSRGEEIFVNYHYPVEEPSTPKWYVDLYKRENSFWGGNE